MPFFCAQTIEIDFVGGNPLIRFPRRPRRLRVRLFFANMAALSNSMTSEEQRTYAALVTLPSERVAHKRIGLDFRPVAVDHRVQAARACCRALACRSN